MKVAFDTSVLVAASVLGHVHEPRAAVWLEAVRAGKMQGVASTHAFAELWATLTALPVRPALAPAEITRLVERLEEQIEVRALSVEDYGEAMKRCTDRGRRSGALFDALHLVAAERSGCDLLLTFNTRQFVALASEGGPRILAPPDPPALVRL